MLQSKISTKKSNVCGGADSGVMRAQFSALTEGGSQQLTLAPLASSEGASALSWTPQAPGLRTTFPSSQHKIKKTHVLSFI